METKRQVPCRWKPPPLTDSSSQIRLLWIYAGKEDEEIRCTVSVWDLEHAPDFRAISYTWGSPQPTAFINIQSVPSRPRRKAALRLYDMRVRVRENARYALWQARLHFPDSYIWIDSVCINQLDLREKTAQVTMMAKIYASAVAVLACIGPSDVSSDLIYDICKDLESNAGPREEYSDNAPRLERVQVFTGADPADLLINLFGKFSSRSYFGRLWILQELHSGRERLVLCGNRVTTWKDIAWLHTDLYDWHSRTQDDEWFDRIEPLCALIDPHPQSNRRLNMSLNDCWRTLACFLCEDARDRVYGVLEILDWDGTHVEKPLPDYNMALFDLAVHLIPRKDAVDQDILYDLTHLLALDELGTSDLIQRFKASRPLKLPADLKLPEWQWGINAICSVGQDCYGRLCADLRSRVVPDPESADEVIRLLKAGIQLDKRDNTSLPSSEGHDPVRICTTDAVSVVAWPEVKPGDILVRILGHVLVGRFIDDSHFRVVGHALLLSSFVWKSWEDWTCTCWTEEVLKYSKYGMTFSSTDLSHAEAVVLSTQSSDGFKLSSRVEHSRLNTPGIGSIFKNTTTQSYGSGPHFGIRRIKETCALHNAEECNKWLENPMRFAAASGCGVVFHRAQTPAGFQKARKRS